MEKCVDARGLSCPLPVLRTRDALASIESGTLIVIVDSVTARDNVMRFAQSAGCTVETFARDGGDFVVRIMRGPRKNSSQGSR